MNRGMNSKAWGGSATATTSTWFESFGGGCGMVNFSLNMEGGKDMKDLWTQLA